MRLAVYVLCIPLPSYVQKQRFQDGSGHATGGIFAKTVKISSSLLGGEKPDMKTKIDYNKLTWHQRSKIVLSVHDEMKRRNPIGINFYAGYVKASAELLDEISL